MSYWNSNCTEIRPPYRSPKLDIHYSDLDSFELSDEHGSNSVETETFPEKMEISPSKAEPDSSTSFFPKQEGVQDSVDEWVRKQQLSDETFYEFSDWESNLKGNHAGEILTIRQREEKIKQREEDFLQALIRNQHKSKRLQRMAEDTQSSIITGISSPGHQTCNARIAANPIRILGTDKQGLNEDHPFLVNFKEHSRTSEIFNPNGAQNGLNLDTSDDNAYIRHFYRFFGTPATQSSTLASFGSTLDREVLSASAKHAINVFLTGLDLAIQNLAVPFGDGGSNYTVQQKVNHNGTLITAEQYIKTVLNDTASEVPDGAFEISKPFLQECYQAITAMLPGFCLSELTNGNGCLFWGNMCDMACKCAEHQQKEFLYTFRQHGILGGGQQFGSNFNLRFEYVYPDKATWRKKVNKPASQNPLSPSNFTAEVDRRVYHHWFHQNKDGWCAPSAFKNPDFLISCGFLPTMYGEVESKGEATTKVKLMHLACRLLCYHEYAFVCYADDTKFILQMFVRDDENGSIYKDQKEYPHTLRLGNNMKDRSRFIRGKERKGKAQKDSEVASASGGVDRDYADPKAAGDVSSIAATIGSSHSSHTIDVVDTPTNAKKAKTSTKKHSDRGDVSDEKGPKEFEHGMEQIMLALVKMVLVNERNVDGMKSKYDGATDAHYAEDSRHHSQHSVPLKNGSIQFENEAYHPKVDGKFLDIPEYLYKFEDMALIPIEKRPYRSAKF